MYKTPKSFTFRHLAAEHRRPRRRVRLGTSVKVVNNPHIILLIRARKADRRRCLIRRRTHNIDLCAFHVELSAHTLTRRMQRDQLATKQVLARRNALGDSDGLDAFVCDQAVDAPFCAVEGVLGDLFVTSTPHSIHYPKNRGDTTYLEPPTANSRITLCIRHLLQIRHNRALVTRVNHIISPTRECMAPRQCRRAASLYGNHGVGFGGGVGAAVAHDVVGGDIVDGTVVGGDADAVADCAAVEGGEDCVGGSGGSQEERSCELHACGCWSEMVVEVR
jgi:hypothetical protein